MYLYMDKRKNCCFVIAAFYFDQNGGDAIDINPKLLVTLLEEKERIHNGLLQYCCLDTLAIVKELRKIRN